MQDVKENMRTTSKMIVRIVFVMCLVLVFVTDFAGLFQKLIGGDGLEDSRLAPRPTNPGYGDTKTDIDIDADIEEGSVKELGKILHSAQMTVMVFSS